MNVLVIGSGGREHALSWKIAQSPQVERLYCAPGNPGVARLPKGKCVDIRVDEIGMLKMFIEANGITLTVIGPEAPLAGGIVDQLEEDGHLVFGPSAAAAKLESSKGFAKEFMISNDIPTAPFRKFYNANDARRYVAETGVPIVIKADGLAAGKGVTVAHDEKTASDAIHAAMLDKRFGEAGAKVVIEDCLFGEEASILAFCDGKHILTLATSQDHKSLQDGDEGPNTGGMGAYSPAPVVTKGLLAEIEETILKPCVQGMADETTPYKGLLYAGLMITDEGPMVVEFNVRFGDPEAQAVLPRIKSDIVPALEACCKGTLDQVSLEYDERSCVSVVMASDGYPGSYEKGKPITGIEEAESEDGVIVFHAGTALDGERMLTNGGRVLDVTALGADLPQAIEKAYAAVKKIGFEGAHYRTDIGQKALARLTG